MEAGKKEASEGGKEKGERRKQGLKDRQIPTSELPECPTTMPLLAQPRSSPSLSNLSTQSAW